MNKQDIERNKIYLQQLVGNYIPDNPIGYIIFNEKKYKFTVEYIDTDIASYYCFKVFDKDKNQIAKTNLQNWGNPTIISEEEIDILGNLKKELYNQVSKNNSGSKNILVFVNGVLLRNDQYNIAYSLSKIIFTTSLNSSVHKTIADVIIVKNGIKIFEQKITQQNISTINLYSGEISE